MAVAEGITASYVREALDYNPATGRFYWKRRPASHFAHGVITAEAVCEFWNAKHAGKEALGINGEGYNKISLAGRRHMAHRLAWVLVHGYFPPNQVDHINGVRGDNRIANLRLATNAQNHQNRAVQRNSKSGNIGVSWHAAGRKWRAQITFAGRRHHLGLFEDEMSAKAAYREAKARMHRFHPIPRADAA